MADLLIRLVAFETENPPGRDLAECAELLRAEMDRLGLGPEVLKPEPAGTLEDPRIVPGFVLAARAIEELTGLSFERAIQRELFEPCGMHDSTAHQTQAFLRRTAVGAFADAESGELRASPYFTLPESGAGAGATPIVTADDMLTFGQMHLAGGVAPNKNRVLSEVLTATMQEPTYDLGIPQAPPMGLGWWMFPIAGTTAPWHGGGSPGATSSFCILPEYDAAIVSFASGPGGTVLNDLLHSAVIEDISGRKVRPPLEIDPRSADPSFAGEYASFQKRMVVDKDGDALRVATRFELYDDEHREMLLGYTGSADLPPVTYTSVAPGQYAPEGATPELLSGFYGRLGLLATLPAAPGRRAGPHSGFRYIPKVG
ncbi:serine hydrolase [Phytohabitans sp. ZYX-F-186]|uniref:Serine hydrolase n=1 Tax=Phytohabitans maris TaxID=3071409 RepID=A0ABU0ZC57_9ACTN|nr:serine hydrolase [Phytohabitans sp. ZYX-F-186]MDQ7904630.1 serine hydrolase [Phytohabitans sp. ZYX-F-186]